MILSPLKILLLEKALTIKPMRMFLLRYAEKTIFNELILSNPDKRPAKVQEERFFILRNLLRTIEKALSSKLLSKPVRKAIVRGFLSNVVLRGTDTIAEFINRYNRYPPLFITISPEGRCNLSCKGCYADSSHKKFPSLDWDVLCWTIEQKNRLWGSYFTVISGGEPLLYESKGNTIIDLARKFRGEYFLMYTNGTLIDEEMAQGLREVGNITPAISVEGYREETERRRGRGVYDKILRAFENLKDAGVPFGCSITATRRNAELILSDEFIEHYLGLGVLYFWVFQYMPIGRRPSVDMMVTPEQRIRMYKRTMYLMRQRGLLIADFWNSGAVSDGCIAAARSSGYFYIDWEGNVTPCVFNHYTPLNIYDVYKEGDLNRIVFCDYFKAIQKWQRDYGYGRENYTSGNLILPCPVRDHYAEMRSIVVEHKAEPINESAAEALHSCEYLDALLEYEKRLKELADPIWDEECRAAEKRLQLAKEQGIDALFAVSEKEHLESRTTKI